MNFNNHFVQKKLNPQTSNIMNPQTLLRSSFINPARLMPVNQRHKGAVGTIGLASQFTLA
jgi:hypothetical protein